MALWQYRIGDWVIKRATEKQRKMMKPATKKCEFVESMGPLGPDVLAFRNSNIKKRNISFTVGRKPDSSGIFKMGGPDKQQYEGRFEKNGAIFSIESLDCSFRVELSVYKLEDRVPEP